MYGKSVHISFWEKRQSERDGHVHVHRLNYIDRMVTKEQADELNAHYNMESVTSTHE